VLKASADPANDIRQIDVHTLPIEEVFTRFSTSPTIGLESPAVTRLSKRFGKNVISPPKTQYWKKVLNYVFGGFNFLMWIAFIVTIVGLISSPGRMVEPHQPDILLSPLAVLQASWGAQSCHLQFRRINPSSQFAPLHIEQ